MDPFPPADLTYRRKKWYKGGHFFKNLLGINSNLFECKPFLNPFNPFNAKCFGIISVLFIQVASSSNKLTLLLGSFIF